MVYIFFHKESAGSGAVTRADNSAVKNKNISNQQLVEELHNEIIRKFEKRKVYSSFKDNIYCADLADM